ncbi:hypothetical protein [Rhizobium sp. ZW T2_16]|uniref:hypothetical protein n=1 Tax=Rhizobium sp. ZW T2_16 TaxID=3378083 RepID=UPI003851C8E1
MRQNVFVCYAKPSAAFSGVFLSRVRLDRNIDALTSMTIGVYGVIIIGKGRDDFPSQDDLHEISKYDRLVDDLKFVISNPLSTVGDSGQFPLLEDWSISTRQAPCLQGAAYGHPGFPGREFPFTSSELVLFAPDVGLARTRSRWFRLGTQLKTGDV